MVIGRRTRLYSLDIIRGLAAVSVFLSHLHNPFQESSLMYYIVDTYQNAFREFIWSNGGLHPGVIVFIVLSGFCIHMSLAKNEKCLNKSYWKYYFRRRFFRIYPVMVAGMILGLIAYTIDKIPSIDLIGNFLANLFLLSAFLPLDAPAGNEILLTVVVECVLYSCYPFILYLTPVRLTVEQI